MAKILIVDDEHSIRETFAAFLQREKHELFTAENIVIALDIIEKHNLDLIITDIIMPEASGLDLLRQIQLKAPDIPVIIMTGVPNVDTATEAVKFNAYDYLVKPITKDMLIKASGKALEFKSLHDSKKIAEAENLAYKNNLELLVEKRTKTIQKILHSTIASITTMLELRDPYTAGHSRRTGNLAVEIGQRMGLSEDIIEALFVSGYLHDIGKIAVPAEILAKPSKLSDAEFEIIKNHSYLGYQVLEDANLPWPVANIILQHHERLDGSGYPNGLKEGEIMLEAKILAVSDVVEAMSSHRPYRPSLGINEALNEIQEHKGILYDPEISNIIITLFKSEDYTFENATKNLTFNLKNLG